MRTTAALILCLLVLGPEASAKEPAPETRKVDKSKGVDPREAVETKRIATLQQIVQKYRAIVTGEREPEEQNRQAAAYLSRVPGIKASGHGLGGAWAQFDDGPVSLL